MVLADFEQDPNRVSVAFITYYYNLLNSNPSKLYQLYAKDASLKQGSYQDPYGTSVETVTGSEAIKSLWDDSPLGGAKVMVQSIESTPSFQGSILTVCIGELALKGKRHADGQTAYKFVQTFVLAPSAKKDVYDVNNDILSFIPDVDYAFDASDDEVEDEDDEEIEEVEDDEVKEKRLAAEKKQQDNELNQQAVEGAIADAESDNVAEEIAEEIDVLDKDSEAKVESEETAEPVEPVSTPSSPPIKPTKGMSWANQIASSGVKNTSVAKVPVVAHVARKETSPVGGSKKKKKDTATGKKQSHSDDDDGFEKVGGDSKKGTNGNGRQNSSFNKRGQQVYPIFIKGIEKDLSESSVTSALEAAFGKVDTCRIERTTGYADFVELDSQRRALGAHTFNVGGVELKLEPRMKKDASKKKKSRSNGKRHSTSNSNGNVPTLSDDGFKRVGKH